MSIVLYHHPYSRAANVVWMLEEVGVPSELRFVDLMKGEHKKPEFSALNPMGKLPVLVDGETVVTESAAIALYLADRYSAGELAPHLEDPARGTYLRWSLFAPSVIEPGSMAKKNGWDVNQGSAGWGAHDAMIEATRSALSRGPFLLGDTFSMADVVFGGTIRYMLRFGMLEPQPLFADYVARLEERPALKRAGEKNLEVVKERGLKMPG